MARYNIDQLYAAYEKQYDKRRLSTLMTQKFTKKQFTQVYAEFKKAGHKSNITRSIVTFQNILSRDRLKSAEGKGLDVKAIRKQFRDKDRVDYYKEQEFTIINSKATKVYSDAQVFFASMIDSGFTEDQAKEAYGY